jgi:hypothetical protein
VASSPTKAEVVMAGHRTRFWLESTLAAACGLLAVVTLFWRDWIEALTGFDPDHHNGSVEWAIVAALAAVGLAAAALARVEWRRGAPASSLRH